MLKGKIVGDTTLEIMLNDTYKLLAIIKKTDDYCGVHMYIRDINNDIYDYIDTIIIDDIDFNNLRKEVVAYIDKLYCDGFFDYYISRYDEMMDAMNIGYCLKEGE